ncbi:hypothetical protein OHA25_06490 [Nonomuraea sp. NBC_00507]|uniref:hypothetical protein n=1 Tax=Nonomuraea sp. NBC_00507 TaxID=2976002 RepID=UPI002E1787F6
MTSTDLTPFSPPGTANYAQAGASFQLAAPVDPAGAFTARSIDDVVRAVGPRDPGSLILVVTSAAHTAQMINHASRHQRMST